MKIKPPKSWILELKALGFKSCRTATGSESQAMLTTQAQDTREIGKWLRSKGYVNQETGSRHHSNWHADAQPGWVQINKIPAKGLVISFMELPDWMKGK